MSPTVFITYRSCHNVSHTTSYFQNKETAYGVCIRSNGYRLLKMKVLKPDSIKNLRKPSM